MSVNLIKNTTTPQSGYTPCACRDCMDTAVSSDWTKPELCAECEEAGCELGQSESDAYDCLRDDAYHVGDAGTGHGAYEYRSGE